MDLGKYLADVRNKKPLVHNITNYVTVNDVANAQLAVGASPLMSDEFHEMKDIAALASAVNINIGTLCERTVEAMNASGMAATSLKKPVVFDPVGVGASKYRYDVVKFLLQHFDPTVIKGNASEIRVLAAGLKDKVGIDAAASDAVTRNNLDKFAVMAKAVAIDRRCVVVITGAIDVVSDGKKSYACFNGHPEVTQITGMGCVLSGLMGAFVANADNKVEAALSCVCTMGIAEEIGYSNMLPQEGNSSYRNHIIDALYRMLPRDVDEKARYEEV
jgi:hydroxyethylthiazole kinase